MFYHFRLSQIENLAFMKPADSLCNILLWVSGKTIAPVSKASAFSYIK